MSNPYVGEIIMFAGTFAPRGYALCDGQLLAISQYDALFSLFGTTYGGDGRTTFGLPDMRGRIPVHAGSGPGLAPVTLGHKGGAENVTITTGTLPAHSHPPIKATTEAANARPATDALLAESEGDIYGTPGGYVAMHSGSISNSGGSQSHNNLMPTLVISFCVALYGVYPSRT